MANTKLNANVNVNNSVKTYAICGDNCALISSEPHTYLQYIRKLRPKKR